MLRNFYAKQSHSGLDSGLVRLLRFRKSKFGAPVNKISESGPLQTQVSGTGREIYNPSSKLFHSWSSRRGRDCCSNVFFQSSNSSTHDHTGVRSASGGIIPMDKNTGRFQLPFQCDGGLPPLTAYFEISGNRDVYYGWSVIDNAYECSMNSPCPLPVSPTSRYTTEYAFAVLDETSCVEFTGMHDGPSKKITGFEGDGKLLRDIIVPSLQSLH